MQSPISKFFTTIASVLLGALCLLVGVDVILRNIFGAGIMATQDLLTVALTLFFFASMPGSLSADAHVRMDILYALAGSKVRLLVNMIGSAGAVLFLCSIGWGAGSRISRMIEVNSTTPTVGLPLWPVAVCVAIACVSAGLVVLMASLQSLANDQEEK